MVKNILNYWYRTEFFNPYMPSKGKTDIIIKEDNTLPWNDSPKEDDKIRLYYDLYFGEIKSAEIIKWMLSQIDIKEKEYYDVDNSTTCLFALKVDENGVYVQNSFSVSSFVWAICKVVKYRSINVELSPDDFMKVQHSIADYIIGEFSLDSCQLNSNTLIKIYNEVCKRLNLHSKFNRYYVWARKKSIHIRNDGSFPEINPATELLQSFYLNDLSLIMKTRNEKIDKFVLAGLSNQNTIGRINIDSDVEEMQKWVKYDRFPMGTWPSQYTPSLMQQIGINICTKGEQEIFSINGPPGTGKTTLLKEIVVSNVIERAKLLVKYSNPDYAFKQSKYDNYIDEYNTTYYCMDESIKQYGIVVASNNNSAVENVSVELPKIISKDRTGRFSQSNGDDALDIYFTKVATKLLEEPAWGLISAKLGKRHNIKKLKDRLWWEKDGITLKSCFEKFKTNWYIARDNFNKSLEDVVNEREKIKSAQLLAKQQKDILLLIRKLEKKYNKYNENFSQEQQRYNDIQNRLKQMESKLVSIEDRIKMLYSNMNIFQRVFYRIIRKNIIVNEWKKLKGQRDEILLSISNQKDICVKQEEAKDIAEEQLKGIEIEIREQHTNLSIVKKQIGSSKCVLKEGWVDDKFWQDIINNEKSQESCPWVYEEYNRLREELFYQALQLNKSFVLSSNCVKQNLMRLFSVWDGKITGKNKSDSYGELLNTLLLVIPIISTTFASVESFLSDIKSDEIGLLVIDEAGQATPQSALGALWRAKQAIIVGDPLQVEPIITTPKELIERFANEFNIPQCYRLPELSVQKLADRINKYGGARNICGKDIWLGCPLLVHRRCINPMFDICNEIAYNNKMFYKTKEPEDDIVLMLKNSMWYDIKGKEAGNKDHTVNEQIEFTERIIWDFVNKTQQLPNLFIITPFRSVAYSLKKMLKRILRKTLYVNNEIINDWVEEHCATIHKFQGKEANEVILVLGCDSSSGRNAAQWVGCKPNIINVAVSRAKYRVAVVGDYDLWGTIPNVQILCNYLELSKEPKLL